jgi:general secretion pathway protein H
MNSPRLSRAFTLIEILVVVSIIGIVLSITVISLGVLGDDRELREEARRLAALIQVAQDEAVMQGREYGIEFMSNGFRFVEYDPFLNTWTEIIGDETLRMRQLPEDAEFDLWIEGQHVVLDHEPAAFDDPEDEDTRLEITDYAPHILVFSSGDMTPFELHVMRRDLDQSITLESNLLGDIKLVDTESL